MAEVEGKKNTKESIMEGISLSISFLIIGIFVYCNPDYLEGETATYVVSGICFFIALMGFTTEISKTVENAKDLFIGIISASLVISIWAMLYHYFPIWWVNLISLLLLITGVYGLILTVAQFGSYIKTGNHRSTFVRVLIVGSEIIAFVASIITILQSVGIAIPFL
ncbi:hypothetical protein ACTFPA_07725 [Bacillus cereus group sp. MYBK59-1]|uniref:hypothetical protein n=1 Tax=Bacillus cereus group TaxID=86661 RepID=UPI000BF6D8E6|nr:hypothetical protein [Bacillus thuringiensis]PFM88113.1 hypothetical protein COJ51_24620 [Bacillus thuringiensis]PGH92541.1 hypothetical protein CN898_26755 [Bacillus thuringiensis]